MRIPVESDVQRALTGLVPQDLVNRLSSLRNQIASIADDTGGSALSELQRALQEYLPIVLGLTKKEHGLDNTIEFKWKGLQDVGQESCIANSWFEVLSVLHMMAILLFSEANSLLVSKNLMDASERNVSEDCKKDSIDLLLKASEYLEFCVNHIVGHLPEEITIKLPRDLQEGVLEAISIQALGQGTELQLGLAIESQTATLSVKRRLACEQLSYFAQAHYCLSGCDFNHGYGKKHILFIKWKYIEAKAAAYYYHGLILDKGTEPSSHINAVCCFLAADELLTDSKKACLSFCLSKPVTRAPSLWGVMKHLHQRIPEVVSRKSQMYGYLLEQDKALQTLPELPDFALSLRPDDYKLPEIDTTWSCEEWETQVQTLKGHLENEPESE
ncbi:hypothetical protein GIB67_041856 [Kingdonia uniflora]|uniref:BRO1 domain-containing protein n=1 Tax=Kingdonia uniflora TaxID=39325 RepID=A0A7J7L5X2_9MAGN|nr:hypothetical protein GIB67_041856 [Kingdonia uniflora]